MATARNSHPEDIKALVRKAGIPFAELGARTGLHRTTLGHALRRCIPAANRAIADFLGVPVQELWPEWFDEDGQRRPDAANHIKQDRINRSQKRTRPSDRRPAA